MLHLLPKEIFWELFVNGKRQNNLSVTWVCEGTYFYFSPVRAFLRREQLAQPAVIREKADVKNGGQSQSLKSLFKSFNMMDLPEENTSYKLKEYWGTRFSKEETFEWRKSYGDF